jgi:hypothetical protein
MFVSYFWNKMAGRMSHISVSVSRSEAIRHTYKNLAVCYSAYRTQILESMNLIHSATWLKQ